MSNRLERTIIFPKILLLNLKVKCLFEDLLKYTEFFIDLSKCTFKIKNVCLSQTLGICLHIFTRSIDLAGILHSAEGVEQNGLKRLFRISQIRIMFLFACFQKPIVSNRARKIHYVCFFFYIKF